MQIRCPHCHHPIEVVDEKLLDELVCPSCGSNITLICRDTTVGHDESALPSTTRLEPRRLGHFELLEEVGLGGFGAVWKARDTVLDRIVALKIPRRSQLTSAEAEYFLRDARAAAQLRHSNIVSVHEVGRDGETFFIASDFIDGASLLEWLSARKLTVREAAALVAEIAEPVQHAHERGVVHRDLKPDNILMDSAGRPHVTDFGLAKRETGEITMTVDGQILGTPAYMSPEQARGKAHEADATSDVYSLGVILFELLTGELPFRGEKRMLILQILNDEPPSPRKLNSRVPRDLETICLKCLEKEAKKRYGTAAELEADLRRFLRGESIHARPLRRVARGWRWCKRQPVVAGLAAAVVLSLMSGTLVASALAVLASRREARAERELSRAEWLLYANQIASAQREWETDNVEAAWKHLESSGADFRGWEYDYLHALFNQNQTTLRAGRQVTCVALSQDGKRIASHDAYGTIAIWDATSGRQLLAFNGYVSGDGSQNSINWKRNAVSFSPDGERLAGSGEDNSLIVWDATTGTRLLELTGHAAHVIAVGYSADGNRIVSGSGDKTVKLWDAVTGQEQRTFRGHFDVVTSVAIRPDGQQVVSGSHDHIVMVWNVATGELTRTFRGHRHAVNSVALSPDGNRIVSSSGGRNASVKIWDVTSGQDVLTLQGFTGAVSSAVYSRDGTRLVTSGLDGTLKVWDAMSGEELLALKGHKECASNVMFNHEGTQVICGGFHQSIKIWDTTRRQEEHTLRGHSYGVKTVAFSPDGKWLVSGGGDKLIRVWDVNSHREMLGLSGHAGPVWSVAVSSDGRWIASGGQDSKVILWNAADGKRLLMLSGHHGIVSNVAFSTDGSQIITGSHDGSVKIWDAATGREIRTLEGHTNASKVLSVAVHPNGSQIASGGDDGTLKIWDIRNGQELHSAILSTSHSIPAPDDSLHRHEDMKAFLQDFPFVYSAPIHWLTYNSAGTRIVSGGDTVKVVDAANGQQLSSHDGHTLTVTCVAVSADGTRIVSGSQDNTLKLWSTASSQEVLALKGHTGGVNSVAFSPNGKLIASGSDDGTIKIWDARKPR